MSIVPDNMALAKSKVYTFDASIGGFLVVYPNKDQKTSLEFKFWAGSVPPAEGGGMGMIIAIVVVVLVIILVAVAVMKIRKNKENN